MLARQLGRTADELADTMSAFEYHEHLSDFAIYPWDARSRDFMLAQISWLLFNQNSRKREKLERFMLFDTEGQVDYSNPDELNKYLKDRFGN